MPDAAQHFTEADWVWPIEPCKGLVRATLQRHKCTYDEAMRLLCMTPPGKVPYEDIEPGGYFRFNHMIWRKTGEHRAMPPRFMIAEMVEDETGSLCNHFGHYETAAINDIALVVPLPDYQMQ